MRLLYLLGVVAVLAVFSPACAGPGIPVKPSTGFTHETSVRIPFRPPDDSVASLNIDDEGTAIFIKHIEIHHGHVNPRKEYWREIYKIDKHGILETEKFGPFEVTRRLDPEGNFIALENGDKVTYIDIASLTRRSVIDSDLANIIRNHYSADYYDSGLVVYTVRVPEKSGSGKGVVIYNTSTREEIRVDFQEEYVSIDTIDFDGENIFIKATKSNRKPPDLYVLGLDGTKKLKLNLSYCKDPYSDDAKLVPGGLIVAASDVIVVDTGNTTSQISRACIVKRYSFDGTEEWSRSIPITGLPRLKLLSTQDNDIISLTLLSRNQRIGFIGYFTADEGKEVYAQIFHGGELSIWPLDTTGSFYIYPQWSLYPDIPPPSGRIALYSYDSEVAAADFNDGIYYFAASPSGEYFAVVSDRTVSIFSRTE